MRLKLESRAKPFGSFLASPVGLLRADLYFSSLSAPLWRSCRARNDAVTKLRRYALARMFHFFLFGGNDGHGAYCTGLAFEIWVLSLSKRRDARLAQMVCIKRGKSSLGKENRGAQRISLKQPETFRHSGFKFFLSLEFLRDGNGGEALQTAHNRSALVTISEAEINFDIVRKCEQDIH